MGIHRTFIAHDGMAKADVLPPRKPIAKIAGGSVHLSPLTGDTLAVCEGIETGLSVLQMTGIPTWAGLSTAGMINLSLPLALKTLVICIDHDEAGIKASHALQRRAMSQGIAVKRLMPPNVGTDFNDFIKEMF
jgi:hypothetical protein